MAADFKSLGRNEQGALIAGGLAIILSFFGRYISVSVDGGKALGFSYSAGSNAWTSYATFGMLLLIAAVAVIAVKAFAGESLPAGVPWNLVAAAAAAVGTLLLILRALTVDDGGLSGVSAGPGWSGYLLWVAAIALTVFAALSLKDSGEKISDFNKGNDAPPAA